MRMIFRTDASQKIGTGHVMRCLTLAEELKKRGAKIEFISRAGEGNLCDYIESRKFKVHRLHKSEKLNDEYCFHSNWLEGHWREDAAETLLIAKDSDWLVVDHYALDEKWEEMLHPHINKIMAIDDLADRKHMCDVLLDQNLYSDAETRYDGLLPKECQKLLGPKFALLREEFVFAKARLVRDFNNIKKILIFFGGVDATNEAGKTAQAIKDFGGEVIIVAGGNNKNYSALEDFCALNKNFRLFKSVSNMAELMASSDLSIGSGGSTSWERASLGLPALVWPIAENQVPILYDLSKAGAVKISSLEKIVHDISRLTPETLKDMSQKASGICDGEGTVRVANKLGSL